MTVKGDKAQQSSSEDLETSGEICLKQDKEDDQRGDGRMT